MLTDDLHQTEPRLLAQMLAVDGQERRCWLRGELGAVLRHQLAAPVEFDLSRLDPRAARRLHQAMRTSVPRIRSFADLFRHPRPPLTLLELTKQFAKASRNHPEGPLPEEIASVLYYASIVAARLRWGRRITDLDDTALAQALRWGLHQAWVDDKTRTLFRKGWQALGRPDEEWT
jgi:hypothetical protein